MNSGKIIGGGVAAGVVFYLLSLAVWGIFKFLPVIPLPLAIPTEGLMKGWQIEHLAVSLAAGILWAVGYAVYGKARQGGWLYGALIFLVGVFPAFLANFVVNVPMRNAIVYGAIVSFVGALLGGKVIATVARKA